MKCSFKFLKYEKDKKNSKLSGCSLQGWFISAKPERQQSALEPPASCSIIWLAECQDLRPAPVPQKQVLIRSRTVFIQAFMDAHPDLFTALCLFFCPLKLQKVSQWLQYHRAWPRVKNNSAIWKVWAKISFQMENKNRRTNQMQLNFSFSFTTTSIGLLPLELSFATVKQLNLDKIKLME